MRWRPAGRSPAGQVGGQPCERCLLRGGGGEIRLDTAEIKPPALAARRPPATNRPVAVPEAAATGGSGWWARKGRYGRAVWAAAAAGRVGRPGARVAAGRGRAGGSLGPSECHCGQSRARKLKPRTANRANSWPTLSSWLASATKQDRCQFGRGEFGLASSSWALLADKAAVVIDAPQGESAAHSGRATPSFVNITPTRFRRPPSERAQAAGQSETRLRVEAANPSIHQWAACDFLTRFTTLQEAQPQAA